MHGAGGGAPKGNKNALRHGLYTAEAIAARQAIRALLRDTRDLINDRQQGKDGYAPAAF
jgi:uncharacterized protein YjcR